MPVLPTPRPPAARPPLLLLPLLLAHRQHPPVFPDYLREGHVYCDWCGHWAVIEDYQTFATEEEFHAAVAAARAERQKEVTSDE